MTKRMSGSGRKIYLKRASSCTSIPFLIFSHCPSLKIALPLLPFCNTPPYIPILSPPPHNPKLKLISIGLATTVCRHYHVLLLMEEEGVRGNDVVHDLWGELFLQTKMLPD